MGIARPLRACALGLALALLAPPLPAVRAGRPAASAPAAPAPPLPVPLGPGRLLVAAPRVTGPFFARSVVLLLEYGDEGALGLVVNRPTRRDLAELLPDEEALRDRDDRVWLGGPVALRRLSVLLRGERAPEGARRVAPGLWVGGSPEVLRRALRAGTPPSRLRVFAGHAGWAPGQLEAELGRGDWSVLPADPEALFERDPDALWRELRRDGAGRWAGAAHLLATRYAIHAGSSGAWRRRVNTPLPSFVARSVFSQ